MSDRINRILVTGSRDWSDVFAIYRALRPWYTPTAVLVYGACPSGADCIAHDIWTMLGGNERIEQHPADWRQHGRAAGPIRNAAMVASGADVCLAFIMPCSAKACSKTEAHGSHGATGCADLAEAHGIWTRRIFDPPVLTSPRPTC